MRFYLRLDARSRDRVEKIKSSLDISANGAYIFHTSHFRSVRVGSRQCDLIYDSVGVLILLGGRFVRPIPTDSNRSC